MLVLFLSNDFKHLALVKMISDHYYLVFQQKIQMAYITFHKTGKKRKKVLSFVIILLQIILEHAFLIGCVCL